MQSYIGNQGECLAIPYHTSLWRWHCCHLIPKATHHERGEIRIAHLVCYIDLTDFANAKSLWLWNLIEILSLLDFSPFSKAQNDKKHRICVRFCNTRIHNSSISQMIT
ncbi:hypothetical protein [uncultured Helicobacter sp.]|uniref:hypothetical protein n=1 Tax=uncultured Helicobacter sp. TaxID=175537 RepID=UPI0025DDD728|nr:hypothetical protein [uncultured Helicobacter sp.]